MLATVGFVFSVLLIVVLIDEVAFEDSSVVAVTLVVSAAVVSVVVSVASVVVFVTDVVLSVVALVSAVGSAGTDVMGGTLDGVVDESNFVVDFSVVDSVLMLSIVALAALDDKVDSVDGVAFVISVTSLDSFASFMVASVTTVVDAPEIIVSAVVSFAISSDRIVADNTVFTVDSVTTPAEITLHNLP